MSDLEYLLAGVEEIKEQQTKVHIARRALQEEERKLRDEKGKLLQVILQVILKEMGAEAAIGTGCISLNVRSVRRLVRMSQR